MKKIISIILVLALTFSLSSVTFATETPKTEQVVALLKNLDIVHGDENGNLNFYDLVTRAEFAKVAIASSAYRNLVSESSNISPFPDVKYTYWGASYIKTAVDAGYINGYPDSTFKPENNVLLEEGVTVCLKLLGYTDEDFSGTWPLGQMAKAKELKLLDGVSGNLGDNMQRIDVMNLIYNTLSCKTKSGIVLISTFDYTFYDDVIIVASSNEDSNVATNKIATSSGMFTIDADFDKSFVGRKGKLVAKNDNIKGNIVCYFIPENQTVESYSLNAIFDNSILVYSGNASTSINLPFDTVMYYKSTQGTPSSIKTMATLGDSVEVYRDEYGNVDYVLIGSQELEGPYIFSGNTNIDSSANVYKDGKNSTFSQLNLNDVYYYSKEINAIWAYSDKVMGVYESAYPTKDNLETITVSGKTYSIETADAYKKLSTGGMYNFGDNVVLLLGKDGKVADLLSSSNSTVYGYVTATGKQTYNLTSGEQYTSNYAEIMTADGNKYQFKTSKDYSDYLCSICSVDTTNGISTLNKVTGNSGGLKGQFSLSKMKIGNFELASDVNILDVVTTENDETPTAVKIYPARLDDMEILSSEVLCYTKNSKGQINSLFLNNVTNDGYSYGVVSDVKTVSSGKSKSTTFSILGDNFSSSTNFKKSLNLGYGVRFLTKNNSITSIDELVKVNTFIRKIDYEKIDATSTVYKISGNVKVYKETGTTLEKDYCLSNLTEAINAEHVEAFYNSSNDTLIRVIVIK